MTTTSKRKSTIKKKGAVRMSMGDIKASLKRKSLEKGELSPRELAALADDRIDYSDIPPLDADFFRLAEMLTPSRKRSMTIRIDGDVYDWLKAFGSGYQSRVNALLKAMMLRQEGRI